MLKQTACVGLARTGVRGAMSGPSTRGPDVCVKMPKLRRQTFETGISERYQRRESRVEEALTEMYLAGVCRCVGLRISPKPCGGPVVGDLGQLQDGLGSEQEDLCQN